MYGKFQQHLQKELTEIKEAGLYKNERNIASAQSAEIVLQDVPDTVLSLDQINTGNMGVDSLRRGNSFAFYGITGGCVDKLLRDDFILYDFFLPINIIQKEI